MIKNIIILTVFAVAIFLLSRYYQQSSMIFKDDGVTLQVKGKSQLLKHAVVASKSDHFNNVDIVQKELTIDKTKGFYEEATINGLYEFNHDIVLLIGILFDATKVEKLFTIRELLALQVTTKSGEVINLFVTDNDSKSFQLLYGLSNEQFESAIKHITGVEKLDKALLKGSSLSEPMTQWNHFNNDFKGMVSSIDY